MDLPLVHMHSAQISSSNWYEEVQVQLGGGICMWHFSILGTLNETTESRRSLFYLTTVVCHFLPPLHYTYGQQPECVM